MLYPAFRAMFFDKLTPLKDEKLDAKMLLQIHDELIFEVDEAQADVLAQRFKDIMENIYELTIPLKTSVNIGSHWGELK